MLKNSVKEKHIEIAKRFKQLRVHLSQKEFAKKIGIPYRTYQYYEAGERIPKMDRLHIIASICEVSVDWILTGGTTKQTDEEIRENVKRIAFLEKIELTPEEEEKYVKEACQRRDKPSEMTSRPEKKSPLYIMTEQLEHIYNEGDKSKIEAIKAQLNAFAPQESKKEEAPQTERKKEGRLFTGKMDPALLKQLKEEEYIPKEVHGIEIENGIPNFSRDSSIEELHAAHEWLERPIPFLIYTKRRELQDMILDILKLKADDLAKKKVA